APGGLFVANIGPRLAMLSPNLRRPERRFGRYGFAWVTSDAHDLTALTAMVEAGQIRPCIEEVLPLADAATAHRILESGRVFGKVVLDVRR
ncbi:MAG TPA: zinc-binding dehydrogenase, partial [Microthrixaceae bacterium]|nr:zinc-binding dehydrogenase [Microthrixaceae bacterium]